jgi:hypothetical protein
MPKSFENALFVAALATLVIMTTVVLALQEQELSEAIKTAIL